MKKSSFSLPVFIAMISVIIIVAIAALKYINRVPLNDNKYKLTLINSAKKIPVLKTVIQQNLEKQQAMPLPKDSTEIVLQSERVYTEQELGEMSEEQFVSLLKDIELRLPKLSDIKQLPAGALHRTPPAVIQAGRELGLIKEILKMHESYENMAAPFYKSCAKNNHGTTPVRALCLTNLIEIKKKKGQNLDTAEYPNQIVELSRMVTDI
ncbi:MAG: hypothetical protein WC635_09920 [Bacteriovorax sp.]